MRFSLARMFKRARPRRTGVIVLRPIVPTRAIIARLERVYVRVVAHWWDRVQSQLLPAYAAALASPPSMQDNAPGVSRPLVTVSAILREIGEDALTLIDMLTEDTVEWAVFVEQWHRGRWAVAMQPHNVSLSAFLGPEDVGNTVELQLQQNVSLVRNQSELTRRNIERIVFEGFQARKPTRVIAKELAETIGISRKRATRIAIDQTVKLSSQLDTERMQQAGLDEFQWQHSGKENFRPVHKARDGKVYKFSDPPADMPGMLPYCGCKKRAVITLS